jgi:hypothetical protein
MGPVSACIPRFTSKPGRVLVIAADRPKAVAIAAKAHPGFK